MKRSFQELDDSIPDVYWELFPEKKEQLERMKHLDESIHASWASAKRKIFALNSAEPIQPKILRIFMRHEFIAATADERSHFLLTVEGRVVDPKISSHFPLGMFFSSISVQAEKPKSNLDSNPCDWRQKEFPGGADADCFRFKVYGDKNCPIKVHFTRSNYALKRYEPPPLLRHTFPMISIDPTEEEVLLALWRYIHYYGLLEEGGSSSNIVRFDEKLRAVFGGSTHAPLHSLKDRVQQILLPARAISVDYVLTTTGWTGMGGSKEAADKRFTSKAVSKAGGRVFDITVDVVDPLAASQIECLNRMSTLERRMDSSFEQIHGRLGFLVTSLLHSAPEVEELHSLRSRPLDPQFLQPPPASADSWEGGALAAASALSHTATAPSFFMHPLVSENNKDPTSTTGTSDEQQQPEKRMVLSSAKFLQTLMNPARCVEARKDAGDNDRDGEESLRNYDVADGKALIS